MSMSQTFRPISLLCCWGNNEEKNDIPHKIQHLKYPSVWISIFKNNKPFSTVTVFCENIWRKSWNTVAQFLDLQVRYCSDVRVIERNETQWTSNGLWRSTDIIQPRYWWIYVVFRWHVYPLTSVELNKYGIWTTLKMVIC